MEMMIGGAYQGKSAYAKQKYPGIRWIRGENATEEELLRAEGVLGFQDYLYKELKAGHSLEGLADRIIEKNPGLVLVCDEVGCGVVPVDAFERSYREAAGRICTRLASECSRVIRVFCGIGTVIKDA